MNLPIGLALAAFAAQADGVGALDRALLANDSATAVLQRWCDRHFDNGLKIRAHVAVRASRAADAGQSARLSIPIGAPLSYRRVQLLCGTVVLSEAENWFVAERLSADAQGQLAGDTPFGVAVRSLAPTRRNIASEPMWEGQRFHEILRHRAVLTARDGLPISEVIETYQRAMLDGGLTAP